MKTAKKTFSVLLAVLLAFCALPTAFASEEARDIRDVFSDSLFSNEEADRVLGFFPVICEVLEASIDELLQSLEGRTIEGEASAVDITLHTENICANGQENTRTLSDILESDGIYVYPDTLGGYLAECGFTEIGQTLQAYGDSWSGVFNEDGLVPGLDWGLDALSGSGRYDRFVTAVGTLFGACSPLFAALLGNLPTSILLSGGRILEWEMKGEAEVLSTSVWMDIFGELKTAFLHIPAVGLYDGLIVPVYRALGLGSVVPCDLSAPDLSSPAAMAVSVYGPLCALVDAVQNDPAAAESLIGYYASDECPDRIDLIGASVPDQIAFVFEGDDMKLIGLQSTTTYVCEEEWLADLLRDEFFTFEIRIDTAAFVNAASIKETVGSLLPSLGYTASETPVTPDEPDDPPVAPDTPDDGGNSSQEETLLSFFGRISAFLQRIVDFLKNLLGL